MSRAQWTSLSDRQLLDQCEVDTYRASGPGGQKRNKTSSAVRLRHLPSGLMVIAEESRSQHENKAKAMRRLKQAFFLKIREGPDAALNRDAVAAVKNREGRLDVGRKDPRFWPAAGALLDVLESVECRVSDAAEAMNVSTANLIDFLQTDPKLWEQVNQMRDRFGHKRLQSKDG